MLAIAQVTTPAEVDAVRSLIREFTAWAFALDGSAADEAPTFQGLDEELATLPGIFAPPAGRLLLATLDGEPAGCVALKPHDPMTSELKRMYVRPAFRGRDIGSQLVAALIGEARSTGYHRVILDSHISMTGAHAIYRAAGFRSVTAPVDFPKALVPLVVFMELALNGVAIEG